MDRNIIELARRVEALEKESRKGPGLEQTGGGGGGTPSGTVVSETAFGQAASAGAATDYSRGDHTHGTPADSDLAVVIHAASSKATPVDADEVTLADSAASFGLKKLTWANLKATLKTYFDTLYEPIITILTLARGGTGADLSATGGANQVVQQASAGAVLTVAQLTHSQLAGVGANDHHNVVTLASDADVLLGLSTQQLTLDSQSANTVFAGPGSGGAADPTFRALVANDLPTHTHSKLVASDGSPDPAFAVDASGNMTNDGGGVIDLTGIADALVLDADNDTSISAPTDDQIDFEAGGVDIARIDTDGLHLPQSGDDIFIAGDEAGVKQRATNIFTSGITDHFDSTFTGYTWAGYAGFVTPANINMSTYPSNALIYNSAAQGAARGFAYQGSFANDLSVRVGNTLEQRCGVRMDDASNSNYFELFAEPSAGSMLLRYRYAVAGVVTGPTTLLTISGLMFVLLKLVRTPASNLFSCSYQLDTPRLAFLNSFTVVITPTRSGLYHENTSAGTDINRGSIFDWYRQ